MKFPSTPALLLLLSACAQATETRFIARQIPAALLVDCPFPNRSVITVKDTNLLIVEYHRALSKCDGQVRAIKMIIKGVKPK